MGSKNLVLRVHLPIAGICWEQLVKIKIDNIYGTFIQPMLGALFIDEFILSSKQPNGVNTVITTLAL